MVTTETNQNQVTSVFCSPILQAYFSTLEYFSTMQFSSSTEQGVIVANPCRLMPPHYGHKAFLVGLARNPHVKKIVVILGSCFETGTEHNCIPATEREKMVRAIFKREGIPTSKYEIIEVKDTKTFEEWIDSILRLCHSRGVTHFCTGNKEDILNVIEQKGMKLDFETINPEENSNFPYHATDIRKLIIEGNYEKLSQLLPEEIMPILFRNTFKEILAASRNQGIHFVPGRQTVDVILLIRNILDGKVYVLLGKRSMNKVDFPGYLALPGGAIDEDEGELPIYAAIREFHEETGLQIELLDNSLEPAVVRFSNVPHSNLEQMFIVGIYSSEDEKEAGTRGGSSQCFGIFIEDDLDKYREYLNPGDDLTNVAFYEINDAISNGLAYQHGQMIQKAITMFEAYPDLKKTISTAEAEEKTETLVISFIGPSGVDKSTAALGTAYELKKLRLSVEYVQEFAKDLVYNGLLGKYIPNQSYIIAEQYKRIYDLLGQVDYIVTDAGLEITALHSSNEDTTVENLAWYLRNKIHQITIFIEHAEEEKVPSETRGHIESEVESRMFSIKLEKYLSDNNVAYTKVSDTDSAIKVALKAVKEYREKQSN